MPRPKSEDPKVAVSLRIAGTALTAWMASGDDWRSRMEALLTEGPSREVRLPPKTIGYAEPPTVEFRQAPKLDTSMVPYVDITKKRPAYQRAPAKPKGRK